jgi:peptidoglycan hydrolase-like protein with peptidoglycan-binding domain
MTNLLAGQDSVSPSGMNRGLSVYAGYGRGTYTNMQAVKQRFPGAKYLSVSPYVTVGVDCLDVEPGDAVPADCPAFVRGWTKVNTVKPVIYANASSMPSVISNLSKAGIARSQYFLWVAEWDHNTAIPSQYDAKQYWSTSGYDADSFNDYMFTGTPADAWPLKSGEAGPQVTALQTLLNQLAPKIGLKPALTVDGVFGPATLAAVQLAQKKFGYGPPTTFGEVTEAYYTGLEHQLTGRTPPPVVLPVSNEVCQPVTRLRLTAEGPHSYRIEFTYPKQGATKAAKFQVETAMGSHLGKQVKSYPRTIACKGTGVYGGQYGGVDTKSSDYIVCVRALAASGHLASEWTSVKLPRLA